MCQAVGRPQRGGLVESEWRGTARPRDAVEQSANCIRAGLGADLRRSPAGSEGWPAGLATEPSRDRGAT